MNHTPCSPMPVSPALSTAAGPSAGAAAGRPAASPVFPSGASTAVPSRRLIDAPTRAFHWLFALCFVGAYLSADGERWRLLHVVLGDSMAGLLTFRVLYGLVGPKQVRLNLMASKLSGATVWLRSLPRARALGDVNWRQGQNLFMALAVVVLLALVVPITLTGYASFNDWGGDWLGEFHEAVGEAFLWVVVGHLVAIAGLSWLRRKNVAAPMFTGRTEGRGPDVAKHNHVWLACLLCAAVLGYVAWEWQQAPNGLVNLGRLQTTGDRGHDD